MSLPPTLSDLPVEVMLDLVNGMIEDSPAELINLVVAYRAGFFSNIFNIAVQDAARQVKYGENPEPDPSVKEPVPLLNRAIEAQNCPLWFIRRFVDALEAEQKGAINGLYTKLRRVEPPLFTAVRAGRTDVLSLLLAYENIEPQVHYWPQPPSRRNRFTCRHQGYAHMYPCDQENTDQDNSLCKTAMGYAVDCFARAPQGSFEREKIENCALILVAFGRYPWPVRDQQYTPTFNAAVEAGMDKYVMAVINRALQSPYQTTRTEILQPIDLLLITAVTVRDNSDLVRSILEVCVAQDRYALPMEGNVYTNHSIFIALENGHPQNAITLLRYMGEQIGRYTNSPHHFIYLVLCTTGMLTVISREENFDYYAEQMRFVRRILDSDEVPAEDKEGWYKHVYSRIVNAVLHKRGSMRHVHLLIDEFDFDTPEIMRDAIQRLDVGVIDTVAAKWNRLGISLDQRLPPVQREDPELLPIALCAQFNCLMGIVVLINRGSDPYRVPQLVWKDLARQVREDVDAWGVDSDQVLERYFNYGFFLNGRQLRKGERDATGELALVSTYVRAVLRIADTISPP
ncbi:hypothetical protein F5Y05DRAFT_422123 [Hypoxylon sp. FL0543]|nr:hypothetical protein F5Y05DRAFT_422123 [Hypoxylon sp. FL0543]